MLETPGREMSLQVKRGICWLRGCFHFYIFSFGWREGRLRSYQIMLKWAKFLIFEVSQHEQTSGFPTQIGRASQIKRAFPWRGGSGQFRMGKLCPPHSPQASTSTTPSRHWASIWSNSFPLLYNLVKDNLQMPIRTSSQSSEKPTHWVFHLLSSYWQSHPKKSHLTKHFCYGTGYTSVNLLMPRNEFYS